MERRDNESLIYTNIQQLKDDYVNDIVCPWVHSELTNFWFSKLHTNQVLNQLTPQLLKPAVAEALIRLMAPIQEAYQASPDWQEITRIAYPAPVVQKKQKKVKDKGSNYPGANKQQDIAEHPKA